MRFPLVLAAACAPPPPRHPPPTTPCARAIAWFANPDPEQLVALPPACTNADAATALDDLHGSSPVDLGEGSADIHYFRAAKFERVYAWSRDEHLVLVGADSPPGTLADYLHALGQPFARLDRNEDDHGSEWVWPGRGVVIVIAGQGIDRVGIFTPQSLANYERDLRVSDEVRYLQ